jgi:hypothetical protein
MSAILTRDAAQAWLAEHGKPALTGYWLEAEGADFDIEDLYCPEHIDPAIAAKPGAYMGGQCWAGDDGFVFCRTCGALLDTGGLTRHGVDEGFEALDQLGADELHQLANALLDDDPRWVDLIAVVTDLVLATKGGADG